MIIDLILGFFIAGAVAILDLAPDIPAPDLTGFVNAAGVVFDYIGWANHFLPVAEAGIMLGILVAYWAALQFVNFFVWLGSKAHLFGGGSN